MNNNECPICFENNAVYYTECCHIYCLDCLMKIKKCAICRKKLIRVSLCQYIKRFPFTKQIKNKIKNKNTNKFTTNSNIQSVTNTTNNSISISNTEFMWLCNFFSFF
jgi:hypothetical protein